MNSGGSWYLVPAFEFPCLYLSAVCMAISTGLENNGTTCRRLWLQRINILTTQVSIDLCNTHSCAPSLKPRRRDIIYKEISHFIKYRFDMRFLFSLPVKTMAFTFDER